MLARDLIGSLDWIAHSLEIVQCHHPAWKVTLADCTADNGLHGRLVVGTPVPVAEIDGLEDRLPRAAVVLKKGGREIDRGVGALPRKKSDGDVSLSATSRRAGRWVLWGDLTEESVRDPHPHPSSHYKSPYAAPLPTENRALSASTSAE